MLTLSTGVANDSVIAERSRPRDTEGCYVGIHTTT
jgi:hypothetical protein